MQYFFIADKIKKKEVRIAYYPTDEIVADFSSKLLEGKMFIIHRNTMLGLIIGEFDIHKRWYKEALQRYDLWNKIKHDLDEL